MPRALQNGPSDRVPVLGLVCSSGSLDLLSSFVCHSPVVVYQVQRSRLPASHGHAPDGGTAAHHPRNYPAGRHTRAGFEQSFLLIVYQLCAIKKKNVSKNEKFSCSHCRFRHTAAGWLHKNQETALKEACQDTTSSLTPSGDEMHIGFNWPAYMPQLAVSGKYRKLNSSHVIKEFDCTQEFPLQTGIIIIMQVICMQYTCVIFATICLLKINTFLLIWNISSSTVTLLPPVSSLHSSQSVFTCHPILFPTSLCICL